MADWNKAASALENAQLPIDEMDEYLLVLWSSRQGYTTKRKLANAVVAVLDKSAGEPKLIADDLATYVGHYIAIVHPTGISAVSEDLRDLKRLKFSQANGFLTMVHHHEPATLPKALGIVLALQIRNITVGAHRSNEYQALWPKWAGMARSGRVGEALGEIRRLCAPDGEFQAAMREAQIESAGAARHILRRLDLAVAPHAGLLPVDVDREHILPKSVISKLLDDKLLTANVEQWLRDLDLARPVDKAQKKRLGEKLQPYLNRLGNQALVHQTPNRAQKDRPFASKRAGYKEMALQLTNEVANKDSWDLGEIESRQQRLATTALKAWPL